MSYLEALVITKQVEMIYDGIMLLTIGHVVLSANFETGDYQTGSIRNPDDAAIHSMWANGYDSRKFGYDEVMLCNEIGDKIREIIPDKDDPLSNDPPIEDVAQIIADRSAKKAA